MTVARNGNINHLNFRSPQTNCPNKLLQQKPAISFNHGLNRSDDHSSRFVLSSLLLLSHCSCPQVGLQIATQSIASLPASLAGHLQKQHAMRFGHLPSFLFYAISLFTPACVSWPLDARLPSSQGLAPRATYSVVPINGDSGSGGAGGSGSGTGCPPSRTVTVTVVETLGPETSFRTVFVPLPTTERVTDTIVITKTIHTVDVEPETTAGIPTNRTATTSTLAILPPSSLSSSASASVGFSSSSASRVSGSVKSYTMITTPVQTALSTSTATATATTTRTASNDGIPHTTYPAGNGTVARRSTRLRSAIPIRP